MNQGRSVIRKIAAGESTYKQHVASGSDLSTISQSDKDSITDWILGESEAYFAEQDNYDETCLSDSRRNEVENQLVEFNNILDEMNP